MFEMTYQEFKDLRSQIVTSSWGGSRYKPMAFTEQGVAMLSSILRSDRAIQVNIQIMRTFTKIRHMISELQKQTDERFQVVFGVLDRLLAGDDGPKRKIGF